MSAEQRIPESDAQPEPDASSVAVYAQTVAGVVQLFARTSDGLATQLTPPPVVNEFTAAGNPNAATADVAVMFLFSGAEVTLQPGLYNAQRIQVVLLEAPAATCVVQTGGLPPTLKTNGDNLTPHYALTLYWSATIAQWVATNVMQWDF